MNADLFNRAVAAGIDVAGKTVNQIEAELKGGGTSRPRKLKNLIFVNRKDGSVRIMTNVKANTRNVASFLYTHVQEVVLSERGEGAMPDSEDLGNWKVGFVDWVDSVSADD